jgi:ribulose-phosphate 3-epimerase
MTKRIKIAAGLSAANFGNLGEEVAQATAGGADYIHMDAQDMVSHLPYLALVGGPQMLEGIRPYTKLPIEVHANVEGLNELILDAWMDAGADIITLPMERYFGHRLPIMIRKMKERGVKLGLTVSPGVPLDFCYEAIEWADRLIVYTREIVTDVGIRTRAVDTVRRARELIDKEHPETELMCDGGINLDDFRPLVDVGVDVLEFSRPVFADPRGVEAAVRDIRTTLDEYTGYVG